MQKKNTRIAVISQIHSEMDIPIQLSEAKKVNRINSFSNNFIWERACICANTFVNSNLYDMEKFRCDHHDKNASMLRTTAINISAEIVWQN